MEPHLPVDKISRIINYYNKSRLGTKHTGFDYEWFEKADQLLTKDYNLLQQAWAVIGSAYAPYSKFHVSAAALLSNGKIVTATNQENASYPVGICAERVLLSAVSAVYTGAGIVSIAISYQNQLSGVSNEPLFPCGICRQSLLEYELRQNKPIRLIMGGQNGGVIVVERASNLLPFGFSGEALKG